MKDSWTIVRADGETFHPGDKVERWGIIESFYSKDIWLWAICKGKKRMRVTLRDLKHV